MARKGRNIYQRKDGRWEGRVILGYDGSGKRKYRSVYGPSYAAVRKKMQEYTLNYGNFKGDGKTIGYILTLWLEQKKKECKISTYASYRRIVEKHLLSYWDNVYPEELGTEKVRKFIVTKKNDGLNIRYIKTIFALFVQALKYYESEHENVHYKIPALSLVGKNEETAAARNLPPLEIIREIERSLYWLMGLTW